MNIVVFDTETTSLEKPFCYNIGYVITDPATDTIKVQREFVVEQVWHNAMLFSTAYYAEKRPLYITAMRRRDIIMDKFGYICRQMAADFKAFNVEYAFAYNSAFDEKVFNFNCDWFKCINPFDNIPIRDIRGFAHHFLVNDEFKAWCEENEQFTESGNYSTTAETMFRYLLNSTDFDEAHTALADSMIELEILLECIDNEGADITADYQAYKSIPRITEKEFTVKQNNIVVFQTIAKNIRFSKSTNTVILK